MDTSMISKIAKAREYAAEPERFQLQQLEVSFHGVNNKHQISFGDGAWSCDCEYFGHHSYCAHTMAMERLLEGMLPEAD